MVHEFKYLGIAAVGLLVLGLTYIVIAWPMGSHKTFSQHVAARRISILYYIALVALTLPLLALFLLKWFAPSLQLSVWFNICIVLALCAQFCCTLVPEIGGWRSLTHRLLAGISALLLVPALCLTLASGKISLAEDIAVTIGLIIMTVCIGFVVVNKGRPSYFLLIQVAYFVAFLAPIMIISYF